MFEGTEDRPRSKSNCVWPYMMSQRGIYSQTCRRHTELDSKMNRQKDVEEVAFDGTRHVVG